MSHVSLHWMIGFVVCVVATLLRGVTAVQCPSHCKCSWILDNLQVNCANQGVREYPVFENIPVEQLDLSGNHFNEFPKQYADIDSLIYLDLSNNKIDYIDNDALIGFTALRTLLLANNSFENWYSINAGEAFSYAPSLRRLSLSGNVLSSFGNDEPLLSESLVELELAACSITSVSGDQLMNSLPNLERLVLSHNPLQTITDLPSRSLRVLELTNCSLQGLSTHLMAGLPNLEELKLSRNTALQFGGALNGEVITAYNLRTIDLSYCNLDEIDLSGLPTLAVVNLRGNMLRSMSAKVFANNTQLEMIDLSQNALRVIEQNSFSALTRLTKLDLSYNEIARLDKNLFYKNVVLAELNLSRNIIEKLTKIVSNSLREINLSWCEITSVEVTALSGLSTLQRLDLSHNLLSNWPPHMRSETLKALDLSYCRISTVTNYTFSGFPELASLHLSSNRLTNPIPTGYLRANKYLDQIWVGDNPWICNCHDPVFIDFYDYLTANPQKLKDKSSLRCASPSPSYGKSWEASCMEVWMPSARNSKAEGIWTIIMLSIFVLAGLFLLYKCFVQVMHRQKRRNNRREYESNQEELHEIRRLNERILQHEASSNAPSTYETNLPSYEDALRMPKLERPAKSMVDLTEANRSRKRLRRSQTDPDGETVEPSDDLQLDMGHRFRSEAMLIDRDKERTAQYGPFRRTGRIDHNNSGSRRFSIEDARFPAAHLKSQNLQSAEQIGNFQSYENSPYTKRKPKIAEIPPFKRATLLANSVEFLTDPEYEETKSKPCSPYAKRKPITPTTEEYTVQHSAVYRMPPAVEDYFGASTKALSSSSENSDFQIVVDPEDASLVEDNRSNISTSETEQSLEIGKRKKRKNSAQRRVSGNFSAASTANRNSTSSSDVEPIVLVHKPMRETLF